MNADDNSPFPNLQPAVSARFCFAPLKFHEEHRYIECVYGKITAGGHIKKIHGNKLHYDAPNDAAVVITLQLLSSALAQEHLGVAYEDTGLVLQGVLLGSQQADQLPNFYRTPATAVDVLVHAPGSFGLMIVFAKTDDKGWRTLYTTSDPEIRQT